MQSLTTSRSSMTIVHTCLRLAFFAMFVVIPIAMIFGDDARTRQPAFEQVHRN